MNKLWLSFLTMLLAVSIFGQTKITGMLKSSTNDKPLYDAEVSLLGTSKQVNTDRIGYFQLLDVSDGIYTLSFSKEGYGMYEQQIEVQGQKSIDLGEITLTYNPQEDSMGVITLTSDELSSDESSAQSSVGLLQSSKDVFAQSAAYELGAYWFRTRGLDNKYSDVLFNGIRMNKIDNGRVDYGNWGGLNDVTRHPAESIYGIDPSDYTFGDLGGSMYVDTRPSQMRSGTSVSYSLTNRSYRQRLMVSHNTGLSKKGWGFMISGSRRWAEEGNIDGTFYDAWAYYLGAEKKFNEKHSLNLTVFGAPYRRSTNSASTQEIYNLMGTGYNAYWGYQNGDKRSSRVKKNHEPIAMLTHHWNLNDYSKLTTTVSYQIGKHAASRLDWDNASNPSPAYYRNSPSWIAYNGGSDEEIANQEYKWQHDTSFSQINWAALYEANRNTDDGSAAYMVVSDVNEDDTFTFNTNLRTQINDNVLFYAGLNYQHTTSEVYRQLDDLLGAAYAWDIDDYAGYGETGYYDENNPDRMVYEDDKFQYDAKYKYQFMSAWFATKLKFNKLDVTLNTKFSNTDMQRNGLYDHYAYDNSFGKSDKYHFLDFGAKMQLLYKINGRNFIKANGAYFTNAPSVNDVFPQGRDNNTTLPNLESAKITSGDLSYILRAPKVKARLTGFYTKIEDEIETSFGYLDLGDGQSLFTAEVLSGVDKVYKGAEFALEAQLTTTLKVKGAVSYGEYEYANNPDLYYFTDEFTDDLIDLGGYAYRGKSYIDGYKLSSSPQKGYSLGLEYRSPKYWWVGVTGNYLADNYISISKSKRTERYLEDENGDPISVSNEELAKLLAQEKFSDEFMLNANIGKSFRFGKYYMIFGLTVNNVLDNKDYKTGGYEQMRLANASLETNETYRTVFGNKYWYNQGRSYFLNVIFRF